MANSIGNRPDTEALARVLELGEPFNTSRDTFDRLKGATLWGRPGAAHPSAGQLDHAAGITDAERETLRTAQYVIFSYETPIAWKLRDGRWMVPAHTYSASTAQQIGACRTDKQPNATPYGVLGALFWNDVRAENGNLVRPGI